MNIRNILMMVLLSLMSGTTIKAQFNTVGCLYNHPANKTKNPQETNSSPIVDNRIMYINFRLKIIFQLLLPVKYLIDFPDSLQYLFFNPVRLNIHIIEQ